MLASNFNRQQSKQSVINFGGSNLKRTSVGPQFSVNSGLNNYSVLKWRHSMLTQHTGIQKRAY